MSLVHDIIRLYSTVLFHDIRRHSVSDDDMRSAIYEMQRVYMPEKGCLTSSANKRLANYNSPAHRCAYLHKYAPFHTAMVCDVLMRILRENGSVYWAFRERVSLIQDRQQKFKLCSLGGGPGSDIVGLLAALFEVYGLFRCFANIVDIKSDWKDTVTSVVRALRFGTCGSFLEHGFKCFNFDYLTADLLEDDFKTGVKLALESADLISMVKFVSAAACESTEWMIKKIFMMMKQGAFVLFIDNAAGGFRELVCKAATDCNLTSVCGPISYQLYTNDYCNITHWGHTSCFSTTVTIHMMQRLVPCPPQTKPPPKTKVNPNLQVNNKLATKCGNDSPIENKDKAPTPSDNGMPILNKLPTSVGNPIPNKPIPNGNEPIPRKLSSSDSNGKLDKPPSMPVTTSKLLSTSSNDKLIVKELSTSSWCSDSSSTEPNQTLIPNPVNKSVKAKSKVCKLKDITNISFTGSSCDKLPVKSEENLARVSRSITKSVCNKPSTEKKRKYVSIQSNVHNSPKHKIYRESTNDIVNQPIKVCSENSGEVSSTLTSIILKKNLWPIQNSTDEKKNESASCKVASGINSNNEQNLLSESVEYLVTSELSSGEEENIQLNESVEYLIASEINEDLNSSKVDSDYEKKGNALLNESLEYLITSEVDYEDSNGSEVNSDNEDNIPFIESGEYFIRSEIGSVDSNSSNEVSVSEDKENVIPKESVKSYHICI